MNLTQLIISWAIFGASNILLGASVMMLIKGGPFAKRPVPPALATFIFIVGLTMALVGGKQNLLQATISLIFPS